MKTPVATPQPVCEDSDPGNNVYTYGSVKYAKDSSSQATVLYDTCLSDTSVMEIYCDQSKQTQSYTANCNVGEVCSKGVCVKQSQKSCTDSDGSANQFSYGTVTYVNEQGGKTYFYDSCVDSATVNELYCSGSDVKTAALGCGTGYECSKGACVKKVQDPGCTDSDNGKNYYSKGTTTVPGVSSTDSCNDAGLLNELYCNSANTISVEKVSCPSGYQCYDGSCVQSTCVDTDQGQNYFTAGKTYLAGQEKSALADYCEKEGGSKMMEYYCIKGAAGDIIGKDYYECQQGYSCSAGACVKTASVVTCKDSDNGKNEYLKGTSSLYKDGKLVTEATDFCPSKSQYVEYYCAYDQMDGEYEIKQTQYTDCPTGYYCSSGACIKTPVVTPKTTCSNDVDGYNIYKKGYVMITDSSLPNESPYYYDSCYDENTVTEAICKDASTYGSKTEKCPEGYSCSDGACVQTGEEPQPAEQSACMKDSDGGKNIYVAGTVSGYDKDGNPRKADDYCSSKTQVAELYCSGGEAQTSWLDCPDGYACDDGACKKSEKPLSPAVCKDSDNGQSPYVYGKLYYQPKGEDTGKSVADYCVGRTKVQEFYCTGTDGTVPHYYWFDCPQGYTCNEGACLKQKEETKTSCSDDTDGENVFHKGSVKYINPDLPTATHYYLDGCADEYTVWEAYCSNNAYAFKKLDCPEGYRCKEGACLQTGAVVPVPVDSKAYCKDSDGFNLNQFGRVIHKSAGEKKYLVELDECLDSNRVLENTCDGTEARRSAYACDNGYFCSGGACVKAEIQPAPEPVVNGTATANASVNETTTTPVANETTEPKPVENVTTVPEPEKFTYNLAIINKWGLYSSPVSEGWGFAKITETDCGENDTVIYAYYAPLKAYLKYPALKKGGSLVAGGQGLWIKKNTEGSCKVELSGTKKVTLTGEYLYDGWNLMGAPYSETAFADLKGTCTVASGPHYYNSDSNTWENPSSLSPGKGYFIKVNGACQLGSSADLPPPPPSG